MSSTAVSEKVAMVESKKTKYEIVVVSPKSCGAGQGFVIVSRYLHKKNVNYAA